MKPRASFITVTLVLVVCVVCPVSELFDQWDHTLQTGSDIDYPIMILAACVGVAYLFARFVPKIFQQDSLSEAVFSSFARQLFLIPNDLSSTVAIPASPPSLGLRV
jgi:hypothetical protein